MLRLGIDTGGTCTDAVLYDVEKEQIVAMAKAPTTHENLAIGIEMALNSLPEELLSQANFMSLSTTLATNACVENKGGRVRLIYIGVNKKVVENSYKEYGFESMEPMLFAAGDPKRKEEPDWDALVAEIKADEKMFDSFAIAQINPKENDAGYEKELAARIREFSDKPIVCAYELFHDLNAIKRGASAFLNAKLLPTIAEFLSAIKQVIAKKNMQIPIAIMRSDGSLMNEEYAALHPVETLLCGPAASLKGGEFLLNQVTKDAENAVIIDMGGTTTDIALIKKKRPVLASRGIEIGSWRTFVKGLYVHTFGLGGDTEVYYEDHGIKLSDKRVISMSALANRYPHVLSELENLSKEYPWGHSRALYTYLILEKAEINRARYSEEELRIVDFLQDGPKPILSVAEAIDRELYTLNFSRLEAEGVVIRSGLTPTDMMCIKGDTDLYDPKAATIALDFMAKSSANDVEAIPEMVYELVHRRMYLNVAKVLMEDTYADKKDFAFTKEVEEMVMDFYDRMNGTSEKEHFLFDFSLRADATLVGVGAPIYQFLPKVAKQLQAPQLVPKEAGVTNALGAIIGDVRVREKVTIEASNGLSDDEDAVFGFRVFTSEGAKHFKEYEDAKELAISIATERATTKAKEQGASDNLKVEVFEQKNTAKAYESDLFLDAEIIVEVSGGIYNGC